MSEWVTCPKCKRPKHIDKECCCEEEGEEDE